DSGIRFALARHSRHRLRWEELQSCFYSDVVDSRCHRSLVRSPGHGDPGTRFDDDGLLWLLDPRLNSDGLRPLASHHAPLVWTACDSGTNVPSNRALRSLSAMSSP